MLQTKHILKDFYQLEQNLAQNPGRQTWIARDISISPSIPVIIKLLAFSPQIQWEEFKLFEREAEILKHLNHPYIPRYRNYFSIDKEVGEGLYWFGLVQDYIPGASLQHLLERSYHFSESQVKSIAIQVLNILIYLHELNPSILHRDIKPSNVILGEDKQVYLVDFGSVANPNIVEGATFTVVGTAGYAPLEQFWGKAFPASDLYALGATLIHLLTGISPADLPQQKMRWQFQDKVSLSPSFSQWLSKLTDPAIERRFNTARQAKTALKKGDPAKIILEKERQKINYKTTVSPRYFALIQSLLFIIIMYIFIDWFASFFRPSPEEFLYFRQRGKSQGIILTMNAQQEDYYRNNGKFFNQQSGKILDEQNFKLIAEPSYFRSTAKTLTKNEYYEYSYHVTKKAVFSYAWSRDERFKSYVGAVFIVDKPSNEKTVAIVCESKSRGITYFLSRPFMENGNLTCGRGIASD